MVQTFVIKKSPKY